MHQPDVKHLLVACVGFVLIAATGLWSWNTPADLFGAADAQFRQALAALTLLAILRVAFRRRRRGIRCHHRP